MTTCDRQETGEWAVTLTKMNLMGDPWPGPGDEPQTTWKLCEASLT